MDPFLSLVMHRAGFGPLRRSPASRASPGFHKWACPSHPTCLVPTVLVLSWANSKVGKRHFFSRFLCVGMKPLLSLALCLCPPPWLMLRVPFARAPGAPPIPASGAIPSFSCLGLFASPAESGTEESGAPLRLGEPLPFRLLISRRPFYKACCFALSAGYTGFLFLRAGTPDLWHPAINSCPECHEKHGPRLTPNYSAARGINLCWAGGWEAPRKGSHCSCTTPFLADTSWPWPLFWEVGRGVCCPGHLLPREDTLWLPARLLPPTRGPGEGTARAAPAEGCQAEGGLHGPRKGEQAEASWCPGASLWHPLSCRWGVSLGGLVELEESKGPCDHGGLGAAGDCA